ncbi:MAG: FKBP-type peptidyl-prolyl cis-trans isomerase N-terminal domain-containing protein [Planctomycetota bacterium]
MPIAAPPSAAPRPPLRLAIAALAVAFAGVSISLAISDLRADEASATTEASPDVSYALGYVIAHRLAEAGIDVDTAALREGFRDAHQAEAPKLSVEQMREALATIVPSGVPAAEAPTESAAAEAGPPVRSLPPASDPIRTVPAGSAPFSLRLDGQIPTGQIDTAVPTTRLNTLEADTEIRQ